MTLIQLAETLGLSNAEVNELLALMGRLPDENSGGSGHVLSRTQAAVIFFLHTDLGAQSSRWGVDHNN